jgi:hypothetical protein
VTLTHRTFAAIACIVCIEATGCGSRVSPPASPVAAQPNQPVSPPEDVANPPAPRAPDPPVAASIPPVAQPAPAIDQCILIAEAGEPIANVALSDRVDASNAPRPSNDSERLLFRQVYETLIRSDCIGRAVAGLAASWRLDGDGRTWIVTLRDNARFSDGSPVTAMDVLASWSGTGGTGELRSSASRLVESVVPISERVLAIRLRSHRTDAPMPLAHADLAVAKAVVDSPWPAGTRSARITSERGAAPANGPSGFVVARDNQPPIRFVVAPGDPRDLLDRGAELLVTRDPATLRYAASLPQFQSVPLAWQRTYVLVTPGRSRTAPVLTESARHALATDAVRGEARGALGPFWWQMLADCEIGRTAPPGQPSPTPRIVYDTADTAARDLAERLVGLARSPGPSSTVFLDALLPDRPRRTYERATGLTGEALAVARRRGTDAGHIVAVASSPIDPCRDLQALMDATPWLDPETIIPLVDTRLHAIVRRGRSGVSAESDGGLTIAGVNAGQ